MGGERVMCKKINLLIFSRAKVIRKNELHKNHDGGIGICLIPIE